MSGAVVLFSGGQDSTTCLAWAVAELGRDRVQPVTFDYGQRHRIELESAKIITEVMGVAPPHQISVEALRSLGDNALTSDEVEVELEASRGSANVFASEHGLPSTFVPGRNLLFLTLGLAYGAQRGCYTLVTGVCQNDAAGYPDCREPFIRAAQNALVEALGEPRVIIQAPLVDKTKGETFALADQLGVLELVLDYTHTCYRGERHLRHAWGYGCDDCPACAERAKGWTEFTRAQTPLRIAE
jgi:7-cyano-7-deazaguanine synthase